jgi:lipoprotein-anchoring transpeptidase ErfK/SrfK
MAIFGFFRHGGRIAWALIAAVLLLLGVTTVTLANTMKVRYERDVTRMVFNDNLELLDDVRRSVGAKTDSLGKVLASAPEQPAVDSSYIVVSINENRLWYKQGDRVLFTTRVATGSGKVLEKTGSGDKWKFETPRGRLVVQSKETDPAWVPPDWHFVEQAKKRRLGLVRLNRGQVIPTADSAVVTTSGNEVVKRFADGREEVLEADDGREIVVNGNIVVPPYGTNQRRYEGVLGTHRLNLGDGYALHGTNVPESIGQSVSHGCVRLRNEDIETLYRMVPVGTPVYIY